LFLSFLEKKRMRLVLTKIMGDREEGLNQGSQKKEEYQKRKKENPLLRLKNTSLKHRIKGGKQSSTKDK
jgi:hypothetical protein